jgi:hypothetical protein
MGTQCLGAVPGGEGVMCVCVCVCVCVLLCVSVYMCVMGAWVQSLVVRESCVCVSACVCV